MSGPFNTPSRPRKPSINITPLIDVMFLLLIFFMVSSTFREYPGIDITLPKAANAEAQDTKSHELAVSPEGKFALDGNALELNELKVRLAAIREDEPDAALILNVHNEADFQFAVDAIDAAKAVGVSNLIIKTAYPDPTEDPRQP